MKTTRGVIPFVAAIVGVATMFVSFVVGISVALAGSGSGALAYQIAFLVGLAVVLASATLAIVNLVKKRSKVLSILTLVVAALPAAGLIVGAIAAVLAG